MKTGIVVMLLAGIVLLAACKGKSGSEEFTASNADTLMKGVAADTIASLKLIKTADMRIKVKNVQQTCEDVSSLTKGYNGLVTHNRVTSYPVRSTDVRKSSDSVVRVTAVSTAGEVTVKIPTEKLEEFMNKVEKMGLYVNSRQMDISDKTLDYLSARMKLKNRAELISQQKAGKVVIKNPANVLLLKDDMVDQQIGNREIDDAVMNSVVSLGFYQSNTIYKETIADDDPSSYRLPFFSALGNALGSGWLMFQNVLLGIGYLWVFVVLIFAGIYIRYRFKKPVVAKA
ncbi:MAG: DUF4349 domain-containing protein [Bacteroidota bacterium]